MNMFKLPGSAAGKEAAIVTYSQRREVEVSLIAQTICVKVSE